MLVIGSKSLLHIVVNVIDVIDLTVMLVIGSKCLLHIDVNVTDVIDLTVMLVIGSKCLLHIVVNLIDNRMWRKSNMCSFFCDGFTTSISSRDTTPLLLYTVCSLLNFRIF